MKNECQGSKVSLAFMAIRKLEINLKPVFTI